MPRIQPSREHIPDVTKLSLKDKMDLLTKLEEGIQQDREETINQVRAEFAHLDKDLQDKKERIASQHGLSLKAIMRPMGYKASGNGKTTGGSCPVCQFSTSPHHDGRQHRSQGKHKHPFTDAELSDMQMVKVASIN